MALVRARVDTSEWQRALRRLRSQAPRAVSRALNRTIEQVRTQAVREIASDTGLKSKDVRTSMRIVRATASSPKAILHVAGSRIPLLAFAARQTATGVTYRIGGRGRRGQAPSAFIATMRSGHRGVFRRRFAQGPSPARRRGVRQAAAGVLVRRLPIDELRGPSLPRVFAKPEMERRWQQVAAKNLPKNLKHEIDFLLRGRAAG